MLGSKPISGLFFSRSILSSKATLPWRADNQKLAPEFREGFQNNQLANKHNQLHEVKETMRAPTSH
jgi:hypothetical protein